MRRNEDSGKRLRMNLYRGEKEWPEILEDYRRTGLMVDREIFKNEGIAK